MNVIVMMDSNGKIHYKSVNPQIYSNLADIKKDQSQNKE